MPFKTYDIHISVQGTVKPKQIDLEDFAPNLIVSIANKITASASRMLLKQYGLGVTEWRILAMLAGEPDVAPTRIAGAMAIDKSSVSRALQTLKAQGSVTVGVDAGHKRRQILSLTPEGRAMHDRVIQAVLDREALLLKDFSEIERVEVVAYLKRMLANVPLVNAHQPADAGATPGQQDR